MNVTTSLPFDPELAAVVSVLAGQMPPVSSETLPLMRQYSSTESIKAALADQGIDCVDHTITAQDGAELIVSVVARVDHGGFGPGIFHTHGGGMVAGQRMDGIPEIASWILEHDAVAVSVDYRRAPEHPDPVPVEDCYAALLWTSDNARELGIDPDRLLVAGASAGGGLAAAMALLSRDRGGPKLIGQVLMCPMIDDRNDTVSARQLDGVPGVWDRAANVFGWSSLLGDRMGTEDVSIYAAPARATDLSGLPPALIDCGSAEVFRDEDVAYASKLWAAGVQAELHVWPGGFHGFDMLAPHTALAQVAVQTRNAWVARLLGD